MPANLENSAMATGLENVSFYSNPKKVQFSLVAQSHVRLPCLSPIPGACSNSCPFSWWCHPTILSSVVPFSSCPQSFPASRSFLMSQLFAWGGQNTGASTSVSVLPINIQDWFPLGSSGLIQGLSIVFSSNTLPKHQFFGTQPSLWSNSHTHTWLLKKI